MNTNNVYYGILRVSTAIKKEGNYFLDGITTTTSSTWVKPVLVLTKKSITGKTVIKDLNTREKYTTEIPLKRGKVFIKMDQLIALNLCEENIPANLPKKDVLKIGNEGLKAIQKYMIERDSEEAKQKIK